VPKDKDTKTTMKGLALSEEQKKVVAELQKFKQRLQREQQKAATIQDQLSRQVGVIAEVTGVVKYLRAQMPSPEEMTGEVTLGEKISLREPKTE